MTYTKKRAPACNVEQTRERLLEEVEDWSAAMYALPGLPAWAKVIAREAGVKEMAVEEARSDRWSRNWLERELVDQLRFASNNQICGYGHVWNKYTGEGKRFRRRLARTKLAGMRRRRGK